MKLYLLVKRKGTKKWVGVIPAKKRATLSKLRVLANLKLKKGFSVKIVNQAQLKRILLRQLPKRAKKVLLKRRQK